MATEHFCLRWNNHQSTLVSVFDNLLESGTLVDCTLAADGRYLKAHKVVLSACSPYLGMLLSQHYDKHPIIILKDVKFDELKAMLDYMYRGEVNISQEQLSTFLKAAETLQIKGLTDTGAEEGIQPNRPPSSNSTTSAPTEEPLSPGSAGPNSPNPKKRKRNKPSDDPPEEKPTGSDQNASVSSLSALKNVSFGSVKREPTERDGDGDGVMSVDDSNDSAMMARPGPSNGSGNNNKGSPWILSADSGGEEMQLTPGQGQSQPQQQQQQQQQYMQSMMQSFYGNMWMEGAGTSPGGPLDMDQEMLAAYRYGRPNWNMNRYLCTTCGRTYSLQASLYNHKKFECGKMPNFICPYCPHRTKQKGNLKTHIKKRHPEFFTEPFMPSPSRLNSMMNTIMMQNTMMQQNNMLPSSSMQNSAQNTPMQNSPQNSAMQNSPMQSSSQRALMQNSQSMMNTSKPQNPSINNLLQAMKQQSQNAGGLSAASLVQALSQSLPNSTSISALDIMQVLAQGAPKNTPSTPVTPHRMSPMNASPATPTASNPPQSPMHNKMASPVSPMPQSPIPNGSMKSELPLSPAEMPSTTPEPPKSPPTTFNTSLSLDPESEDSSDTPILPSYPITQ